MAELQLISSDSHVSEPPDLWVQRIDTKYRDRAPQVVLNPEGQEGAYFVYEGYPPHNLAIGLGAGRTPEELAAFLKIRYLRRCSPRRMGPGPTLAGYGVGWGGGGGALYYAGVSVILAQRCRVTTSLFPRLQRLAGGVLQLCAQTSEGARPHFLVRPQGGCPGAGSERQAGPQGRHDLVLPAGRSAL